ncbi:MAG TPA: ABC transporter permease [Symbiobacteriaceae bacterium]|nr:ABC transporter permease [Symbiobacteriaceae bacterium]
MAAPVRKQSQPVQDASLASQQETTQLQHIWKQFKRNRLAVAGLIVLILLYLVAIFAPLLAKEPLDFLDVPRRLQSPTWAHPFGTDNMGRDILARVIWGSRISLSVGFVAMGISVVVGTLVGAVAGYYGGRWIDIILMRITETISVIPVFFLLITVVSVIRPSIYNIMLIIGLTSWPGLAQVVRSQFLSLRQRDYTEASRAMGATDRRLIFRHILPNAAASIIVSATLRIGGAIITESSLSFLGLGTQPPNVSWGQMLSTGRTFLRQAPWASIWPGVMIFVVVMAFNFVGDGLRDALDPKMKR